MNKSERIIIIDDQPFASDLLQLVLSSAGFTNVVAYSDPRKAFKDMIHSGRPALVITDQEMPDVSGIALLSQLSGFYPDIKGIIVTGNPDGIKDTAGRFPVVEKSGKDFGKRLVDCVKVVLG